MYALDKVYRLHFLYYIFFQECKSSVTKVKIGNGGCMDFSKLGKIFVIPLNSYILTNLNICFLFTDIWFSRQFTDKICGGNLKQFCEEYISVTKPLITLSWVAVMIIIVGNVFCLMSMSAGMNDLSKIQAEQRLKITFTFTILHPHRFFASSLVRLVIFPDEDRDHHHRNHVRFSACVSFLHE